jgi:AcrR family transcriptional regulator
LKTDSATADGRPRSRKLPKEDRRRQLLETALLIVRDEGADQLTLGNLAARAGVSKPIAYDHFGTRAGLLIELYKMRHGQQAHALETALTTVPRGRDETVDILAASYIHASVEMCREWQAVGAALAGSEETEIVHRELLDSYVDLFTTLLGPHSTLPSSQLRLHCVGVIGAGEAILAAIARGISTEAEAAKAFASLIWGGLGSRDPSAEPGGASGVR